MKNQGQNEKPVVYIPQWHMETFLYFLRGHLIEGDMTPKQMVIAIDNYLDDVKQAEIEEVQR